MRNNSTTQCWGGIIRLKHYGLLIVTLLMTNLLFAQDRKITGTVTSVEDKTPLPGVNVVVKGTSVGTITDIEGNFTLNVSPEAQTLVFSFIGLSMEEIVIGNQTQFNIAMKQDVQSLSEVVVTAFGLEREKKALGYSVQGISGEEVAQVPTQSVVNNLSGRVAGLQVSGNSTPGGSPEFVIRGFSSVAGNNQPLVVIDGVPMQQTVNSTSGERSDNQQYGGGISEIDPNNIAEMSILKGPNAAALYGSRAANGVILITTKTGKGTEGIGVDVNFSTTFERPLVKPQFQNIYGGGSGSTWYADGWSGTVDGYKGTAGTDESWGAPMDGRMVRQWWTGTEEAPLVPEPDNWEQWWETGQTLNGSVAISSANENGSFRLAIGRIEQKGIAYNNDYYRNNFRLNTNYQFTDKLTVTALGEYIKSGSDNRGFQSGSQFIWHQRHVNFDQLENYRDYEDVHIQPPGNDEPPNWQHTYFTNPYFSEETMVNPNEKDRFLGNISLNYEFADWLSLMVRSGTDIWTDTRINVTGYARTRFSFDYGSYNEEVLRRQENNSDFIFSLDKTFGDFSVVGQFGGIHRTNFYKRNYSDVNDLTVDGVYALDNNASPNTDESAIEESVVNSVFGSAQFGFRNYLFLDVTGRNDWSSTLPTGYNSYFYPSVSLSAVVTDMLDIQSDVFSFAKLRASWAQVGNDADPYLLQQVYDPQGLWDGSVPKFSVSDQIANSNLKPERTTGIEVGADLRFLNGRIGLDVTYYDQTTEDQILAVDISRASGYESRVLNAGKITNKGVELMLSGTILQLPGGLSWDASVNFAKNENEVVELADGLTSLTLWSIRGASLEARVGEAYGNLYGNKLARTEAGEVIFRNGYPYNIPGQSVIGNITPDWIGGISNTVTYKGLSVSALIDIKKGGDIYDMGSSIARITGVLEESAVGREEGVIGQGVMNIGTEEAPEYITNDVVASARTFYGYYSGRQYHEAAVFDGSYVKLREARVSYQLPSSLFNNIFLKSARISVIGRNLAIFHSNNPHIDPEISAASLGYNYGQLPSTRSVGFDINLKF
ncbi:TonB-linked SusC/RagA family outer membrane protein [Catalinimonas alkaloidigena]|uniref:SusC/RagA family TonB-linked outer membrane protein n=1 Tax=Catalinimonas alkaloidigena TaxID=1075417 RepID=UPI0024067232|nr:SusC/RagA family TonB-linked outer membrane protein [Catalinimonas alkaloidigena]MDF9796893.1 TonB-linked SusC/RagA family outer membrane protein [Catalinimonas alkaloidigena]